MWAAAAAVVAAALRAPVVLAAALVVPVRRLVGADPHPLRALVVLAVLVVLVHRLVRSDRHLLRASAAPLLAPAVLVVHLVLEAAVPLRRLLSPQSSSVAMAWSSPPPVKPSSSPVRRSRWQPRGRTCPSA